MQTMTNIRSVMRQVAEAEARFEQEMLWGTVFDLNCFSHRHQRRGLQKAVHQANGVLLDVGCARRPYEMVFSPYVRRYFGADYPPGAARRKVPNEKIDVWVDAHWLPIADSSVDTVLCLEVLEHLAAPWLAVGEIARVLRRDGIVIVTVPFLFPVHGSTDRFRYTPAGLRLLLAANGLTVVDLAGRGAFWAFFSQSLNQYIQVGLFRSNLIFYRLYVLFRPLFWILACLINVFGLVLDRIHRDERFSLGYILTARKECSDVESK
jgi:SAM-dependent methyltransferase